MLLKLLGWIWLVAGIWFLFKPEVLKARLQKKSLKQMKKIFVPIAVFLGLWLIVVGFGSAGIFAKFLMLLGIVALIKSALLLKTNVADKIIEWYGRQSLAFYRLCACCHIILAVVILLGS